MIEQIKEMYLSGISSPTEIGRIVFPNLPTSVSRKRVARVINKINSVEQPRKEVKPKADVEIPFVLSAWNQVTGSMMDIDQYCAKYGLPRNDIKDYKLVTHTGTPYYNIHFKDNTVEDVMDFDFIDDIVKKNLKSSVRKSTPRKISKDVAIRAVYSDTHVGMSPNPDGISMFGGKWDEDELMSRMSCFCDNIINKALEKESEILMIDDLGDFMDGWEGYTVRRDHSIPQNISTKDAFDLGVKFKVSMVDYLISKGEFVYIQLNNVCNDNHAGSFGYVVNSAVKSILEAKYPSTVYVNNIKKFMDHYFIGHHCFILCHGKDEKHMKFGLKTNPNEKIMMKIDQYMKHNDLYNKAKYFELSKGDSHQMIFDFASSDDFKYMNYPAFSPSSDWVQTNFKKGKSGFVIQSVDPNNQEVDISYKFFNWKK